MTTASAAIAALRTRLEAANIGKPLRWQNEDGVPLPDVPAPFVHGEFHFDQAFLQGFGAGRGGNLWRNQGVLELFAFVPRGQGLKVSTDLAETIAAIYRGHIDNDVSCFAVSVRPGTYSTKVDASAMLGTQQNVADNYFWTCVQVQFFYDQVG
jgi:hypothetical protein